MDFMNRGAKSAQTPAHQTEGQDSSAHGQKSSKFSSGMKWGKIGTVGFLAAVAILIVGVLTLIMTNNGSVNERQFVDKGKFQAVFLNGGQVYFGKIKDLNSQYIKVDNIYYLRVNQQVQPDANAQSANQNDISLVKLGCELHGPQDNMLINREQVIFWENLKDDGQVAKAVAEYVKQNPNGQKCDQQQSTNTNSNSNATTPNTTNTNSTNKPATSTTPTTTR